MSLTSSSKKTEGIRTIYWMFEIDSVSISAVRRQELMQGLHLRPNSMGMLKVSSNCNFRDKNEDSFFSNDCEGMTPFTPNSQIGSK